MRQALTWITLGSIVPMLQSTLVRFLPAPFCPDLSLLLAVAIGLCGRSVAGGLIFSAFLGCVADLLSGSLLGQHVLLRVLAFAAARSASVRVNLVGTGSRALFVAVLTLLDGLAMGGLTAFFSPGARFVWIGFRTLVLMAGINALAALPTVRLVSWLLGRLRDEDGGRRLVRIEPRGWAA